MDRNDPRAQQRSQIGEVKPAPKLATVPESAIGGDLSKPGSTVVRHHDPSRWWRDARRRRFLALADLTAAATAIAIVQLVAGDLVWAFATLPVWIVIAKSVGLYDRDHRALRHLTVDELPQIAGWAGASVGPIVLLAPLFSATEIGLDTGILLWAAAAFIAALMRGLVRLLWWRMLPPEIAAVIGEGAAAGAIRRKVELFSDMHIEITEVHRPEELSSDEGALGHIVGRVDRVILAIDSVDVDLIGRISKACRRGQVKLSVVSPLRGRAMPAPGVEQIADLPVLEYRTWDVSRSTRAIKRSFDIVVSAVLLILLIPLIPLVALAIRIDSRGPAFFTQIRSGREARPFRMYKLRTMVAGAEEQLDELVDIHKLPEPVFKFRDDPRVTRVGRFLRRFSIDELPQLLNVLLGEMSLVGPRPEQVELAERHDQRHRARFDVRPGISGPMQVYGRGALSYQERMAVELDYVENLSVARDLRILLHTIPVTLRGTGAF